MRRRAQMQRPRAGLIRCDRGFTFLELIVSLWLFAAVSLFILQSLIAGMGHAGRANERTAATTIAIQIMEQIRASVNPYEMVGFSDLLRSPLPLPAPYAGVVNPTHHVFEVAVDVTRGASLTLTTVSIEVYRPADVTPFITMTTVLDDQ